MPAHGSRPGLPGRSRARCVQPPPRCSCCQILDESVAGQLTKSYQYSPWGERLSQVTHNTDGTTTDSYYGYNSHTDVETLTDSTGQTKATYGYTAYGNNDTTEFTGIDKPDAQDPTKEPYNAYRFNAKRWDQTSGTYDMGFRNYDPGLNRFTSRDMYNGALADMNLSTDPLTGNRYAFGGGNPSSEIELDGHTSVDAMCEGISGCNAVTVGRNSGSTSKTVSYVSIGKNFSFNESDPNTSKLQSLYHKYHGEMGPLSVLDGSQYPKALEDSYQDLETWKFICGQHKELCANGFGTAVNQAFSGMQKAIEKSDGGWRCWLLGSCGSGVHLSAAYYIPSSSESPYLYRGVWPTHDGYADALRGAANPRDPESGLTIEEHNAGYPAEPTRFTSWTTDANLASARALDGVVLRIANEDGEGYTRIGSPDYFGENEVGIEGQVAGADVFPPNAIPPEIP